MSAPIPHLLAPVRAARPAAPARRLSIWLAPPEAADAFEVSKLSEADRQRWLGLTNRQRREDFAVSRALLNRVSPRANDVSSLSHSGGHAAICLGPAGCRVGVDVEWHRARDVIAIARFAFDAEELAALEAATSPQRERLFYAMWVFKEAAAKALRLDLPDALRHCTLVPHPDGLTGVIPTHECWAAWIYEPRPGLSLAAIQVGGAPEREPLCLDWTEITVSWRPWRVLGRPTSRPPAPPASPASLIIIGLPTTVAHNVTVALRVRRSCAAAAHTATLSPCPASQKVGRRKIDQWRNLPAKR